MFKTRKVKVKDLEKGDIIISHSKQAAYVILEVGRTMFHNHLKYKVMYVSSNNTGLEKTYLREHLEENALTRTILRWHDKG